MSNPDLPAQDTARWPGDETIERKKRTSGWELLLMSLGSAGLGGALVAWVLFAPEASVRLPWFVVLLFNLIGPLGVLAVLVLLSLLFFVLSMREFFGRK